MPAVSKLSCNSTELQSCIIIIIIIIVIIVIIIVRDKSANQ